LWKLQSKDGDDDEKEDFSNCMTANVKGVLNESFLLANSSSVSSKNETTVTLCLIQNLIPHVPHPMVMETLGSSILSALAAASSNHDPEATIIVVHAMASVRCQPRPLTVNDEDDDVNSDDVLFLDRAAACTISKDEAEMLLDVCLVPFETLLLKENCAKLAAAAKSVAFLAVTGGETKLVIPRYKRVSKWLLGLIMQVQKLIHFANCSF
jgi:hypothetical protein